MIQEAGGKRSYPDQNLRGIDKEAAWCKRILDLTPKTSSRLVYRENLSLGLRNRFQP